MVHGEVASIRYMMLTNFDGLHVDINLKLKSKSPIEFSAFYELYTKLVLALRINGQLYINRLTYDKHGVIITNIHGNAEMAKKAPGKHYRNGISLMDAVKMFDTEEKAEQWFIDAFWDGEVRCVYCESDKVRRNKNPKRRGFYCNPCRRPFTVKTGTVMHDSKLPLSKWAIALYLYATNLKGVSSLKLHRDLGITQKSAWHMAHRIRKMWDTAMPLKTDAEVEIDET